MRILVVDDDPLGSRMLHFLLTEQGYSVELAENARGALACIQKQLPDLILLDVNMPHLSGFEFCRGLRDAGYDVPVIFVTAKGELEDRLHGLRLGADDYICKPFQPAELSARVEAVLRRYQKTNGRQQANGHGPLRAGDVQIDVAALRVTLPDRRSVLLTPTEMKVLLQLTQRAGEPVQRGDVMASVWGDSYGGESNIVDVYVRRLRRKLERDPSRPVLIQAARGVGYKFAG
ncbi:MAG TPA: response regulator transcription factor [Ktedonobacterales bacterium]|nr:response regulator transcription factor [Ktedonobacterales bacterium]